VTTAQTPPPYIRNAAAPTVSYDARQVATAYGAPLDRYDGSGVTIGVVELGGAYDASDLQKLKLPAQNVTVVPVDGATPTPDPQGADGEVMLDVEIIAAVAPGAKQRVYFAKNDNRSFLDAVTQATRECQIVSISWGGPESSWDKADVQQFSAAFSAARRAGVTVFAAAGDTGAKDSTAKNTTDYPASDPSVVGCGGTRLTLDAAGRRAAEVVWNDDPSKSATGGGVSTLFPGRQVPDVAGNADPDTGYRVTVDGKATVVGGTSAVAPLYAAMTAVLRQAYGKPWDWINAVATNPTTCFDVTVGDNGGFKAGPGRDEVTGFGVVDMGKLLAVLQSGVQIPAPGGIVLPSLDPRSLLTAAGSDAAGLLRRLRTAARI
jgi:kumamolisin